MFSDVIKAALEKEVVGQTIAVNTVVRGVTRLASGVTPRERPLCAYMFMGPSGTGKSHVIRTLARLLHGDDRRIAFVDSDLVHGDPRMAIAAQLVPLLSPPAQSGWPPAQAGPLEPPRLSVIKIDFVERAPKEVYAAMASVLETGRLTLPDGRPASLRGCMVFLTSRLCGSEILDEAPRIGFSGALDEDDRDYEDQLFTRCFDEAEQQFGSDLVGCLDRFVVFHRLQEEHLDAILDRRVARLNRWLAAQGLWCELQPRARDFLLGKGKRDLRLGARDLLRAHQQFVEFPIADLLVSGRMTSGGTVLVDRLPSEDHLHFAAAKRAERAPSPYAIEIPVG